MAEDANYDEILGQFKADDFLEAVKEVTFCDLKERNKAVRKLGPSPDNLVQATVYVNFGDAVPGTTANDVAGSATYLMLLRYAALRIRDGKPHCEAIKRTQAEFIDLAYDVANGKIPDADGQRDQLRLSVDSLKSAFGNFRAYVGGDAKNYVEFLSKVTHDALTKTHPDCKGLDENLLVINKKYSL